jgi:hypothetical protein
MWHSRGRFDQSKAYSIAADGDVGYRERNGVNSSEMHENYGNFETPMQKSCKWYHQAITDRMKSAASTSPNETARRWGHFIQARRCRVLGSSSCREGGAGSCVAASLVSLHVAADAEGFATARLRTLVGLFAGVAVAVYAQAAGSREGLVTCRADVAVLRLREL